MKLTPESSSGSSQCSLSLLSSHWSLFRSFTALVIDHGWQSPITWGVIVVYFFSRFWLYALWSLYVMFMHYHHRSHLHTPIITFPIHPSTIVLYSAIEGHRSSTFHIRCHRRYPASTNRYECDLVIGFQVPTLVLHYISHMSLSKLEEDLLPRI